MLITVEAGRPESKRLRTFGLAVVVLALAVAGLVAAVQVEEKVTDAVSEPVRAVPVPVVEPAAAEPETVPVSEPVSETREVADPQRVVIPAISVDAPIVATGLLPDGAMAVPDFGLAGWYDLGPRPGASGPAVIAGHVDSRQGPDVFYGLRELVPGDEVFVDLVDGTTERFVVQRVEQRLKDDLPVDDIWNETTDPVLRLITCGGDFDRSRRSYRSNVIVYAEWAGTSP